MEVGRIADAHRAVLVAPDRVGCGSRSNMEVLDFGAEGFTGAARRGICVWTARWVEWEVDGPGMGSPAPGGLVVIPGC